MNKTEFDLNSILATAPEMVAVIDQLHRMWWEDEFGEWHEEPNATTISGDAPFTGIAPAELIDGTDTRPDDQIITLGDVVRSIMDKIAKARLATINTTIDKIVAKGRVESTLTDDI